MTRPKLVVAVKEVGLVSDDLEIVDGAVPGDIVDRMLNEWDAYATEEAIRIRERLGSGEVVVVSLGDRVAEDALRRCLAMGADRAVRVEGESTDPISTARMLADAIVAESPDLVLCGVQSSDSVQAATGCALAGLLELPVVAVVKQVNWQGTGPAVVHRELEGGLVDVVEVETPAVLTIQTGINQPRYATLRAIKQAEQTAIAVVQPATAGPPAYDVARMFLPEHAAAAEVLGGDEPAIATRILEIVRERVS